MSFKAISNPIIIDKSGVLLLDTQAYANNTLAMTLVTTNTYQSTDRKAKISKISCTDKISNASSTAYVELRYTINGGSEIVVSTQTTNSTTAVLKEWTVNIDLQPNDTLVVKWYCGVSNVSHTNTIDDMTINGETYLRTK